MVETVPIQFEATPRPDLTPVLIVGDSRITATYALLLQGPREEVRAWMRGQYAALPEPKVYADLRHECGWRGTYQTPDDIPDENVPCPTYPGRWHVYWDERKSMWS